MISISYGVLPFYAIMEQASREPNIRTEFTLIQLEMDHANTWLVKELEELATAKAKCL